MALTQPTFTFPGLDLTKYAKVKIDNAGSGTVYIGVTEKASAADGDTEWAVCKQATSGDVGTFAWAGGTYAQKYTWADRASHSY